MVDVTDALHAKVIVLAYKAGDEPASTPTMMSGSLFISGSKLCLIGASGIETVTSG